MNELATHKQPVLLFDGECNVCNHWVDFMLKHEKEEWFLFASLQSEEGQGIVENFDIPKAVDSVVVVMNGRAYLYSDAVFQALEALPWFLKWLRIFRVIPVKWRDRLYKRFAENRYRLFGKRGTCRLPSANERKRFLG